MGDTTPMTPEERQELIAFLAGELDRQKTEEIEARLRASAKTREELAALRKTWELLDYLPMPAPKEDFTHRTVEMVALESGPRRRPAGLVLALWFLGLIATAGAGWAVAKAWPDPHQKLIEDLPVIERLDEYQAIGDFEFLRRLHDERILQRSQVVHPEPMLGGSR